MELEYRVFNLIPLMGLSSPPSSADDSIIGTAEGIAVPFEKWSRRIEVRQQLQEKFVKTSFDKVLKLIKQGRRVVDVQINHQPSRKITDTNPDTPGMLRLEARELGLYFIADFPNTPIGRWANARLIANQFGGVSVGFKKEGATANITQRKLYADPVAEPAPIQPDDDKLDGSDVVEGASDEPNTSWAVVKTADLREISLLTRDQLPAYEGTSVTSANQTRAEQKKQLEQLAWVYDVL